MSAMLIADDGTGERLWTATEFSDAIRVDPRTITRWADTGRVPCIRHKGRVLFRDSVVQAVLNGDYGQEPPDG